MHVLFFNKKKHGYGIKDAETGVIIKELLQKGETVQVKDPATNKIITDTIQFDYPVKQYFLVRLQKSGHGLENIVCYSE